MIRNKKFKYIKLSSKTAKSKKENAYDIGLSILRPILEFTVIMTHFYDYNKIPKSLKYISDQTQQFFFHVRVFFIISFYYSKNILISNDYKKQLERLIIRLAMPYFLWPIIFFLLDRILKEFISLKSICTFKALKRQILLGFSFLFPLWFQFNLILISILFTLIILIFKKCYNFILIIISIISFIYQYNGKNVYYVSKLKIENLERLTVGRIIEMIPCGAIGFLIASSGIMNHLRKFKLRVFIVCSLIFYFLIKYNVLTKINGYAYQGINMFILSICIFIAFAVFPSELIKNKLIIKIIKQITNYTAGIYYIHVRIEYYISNYFISIKMRTLKGCAIIYIFCYLISFIGCLFFGKTKLRYLFQ